MIQKIERLGRLDPHYKFKWQSRRKGSTTFKCDRQFIDITITICLIHWKQLSKRRKLQRKCIPIIILSYIFFRLCVENQIKASSCFFFFLSRNHHHQPAIHPRRLTWRHFCIFLSFFLSFFVVNVEMKKMRCPKSIYILLQFFESDAGCVCVYINIFSCWKVRLDLCE